VVRQLRQAGQLHHEALGGPVGRAVLYDGPSQQLQGAGPACPMMTQLIFEH